MHGAAQWGLFINMGMGNTLLLPGREQEARPRRLPAHDRARAASTRCTIVGDAFARPLLDELANGHVRPVEPADRRLRRRAALGREQARVPGARSRTPRSSTRSAPPRRACRRATRATSRPGVSTGDFRPLAGAGVVSADLSARARARRRRARLVRAEGPRAARLPRRRGEDRADLPGDRRRALVGARRPRALPRRRRDRGARPRLGHDQLGRREDLRRGGRARAQAPPRRVRRRRRRAARASAGARRSSRSCSCARAPRATPADLLGRGRQAPRPLQAPEAVRVPRPRSSAARAARPTTAGRRSRRSRDERRRARRFHRDGHHRRADGEAPARGGACARGMRPRRGGAGAARRRRGPARREPARGRRRLSRRLHVAARARRGRGRRRPARTASSKARAPATCTSISRRAPGTPCGASTRARPKRACSSSTRPSRAARSARRRARSP